MNAMQMLLRATPPVGLGAIPWGSRQISGWGITGWGAGFGAAGASDVTMGAARALNAHLTVNGCNGCDNIQSQLRQLTFAFKAACLTDAAVSPNVNLNVSTPLAMTGFGPGTNSALSFVLGNERTYLGGPCTDDDGNCTAGNLPTPQIPPALQALAAGVISQIQSLISQQQGFTAAEQAQRQGPLLSQIITFGAAMINQLGFEAQKFQPAVPVSVTQPEPAPKMVVEPPSTVVPASMTLKDKWNALPTSGKFAIGGLAAVAVVGGGVLVYRAVKK